MGSKRIHIHPSVIWNWNQKKRELVRWILIFFFLILPWMGISGKPALQLDISHREFWLLGAVFRAHDTPFVLFFIFGFGLFVALMTALFGRVWCGWACPQTVFIESIFRRIETLVEGDPVRRRRLDAAPMTLEKFLLKFLKWSFFLIVSLAISHSILALFIGGRGVLNAIQGAPGENWGAFVFIGFSTLVFLIDFGWLREQFCLLACPYGRIQSVMMDRYTRTVFYDQNRKSDCIDCFRCVQVCPTGIDIRNGSQLECIACNACADVCDDVMTRIKKPLGLIRTTSEAAMASQPSPWIRPRIVFYSTALLLIGAVMGLTVHLRRPISVEIIKIRGVPFQTLANGMVSNIFHAEITNREDESIEVSISLPDNFTKDAKITAPENPMVLTPGQVHQSPFVVEVPAAAFLNGRLESQITFSFHSAGKEIETSSERIVLSGPYRAF